MKKKKNYLITIGNNSIFIFAIHEHSMLKRCHDLKPKCVAVKTNDTDWLGLEKRLKH